MALDTIDVHGEILAPVTNVPAVGTVTFKIVQELRDNVANIVYSPQTFVATLDVNGEFTITLPVTDDADITPTNWSYWVVVNTDIWYSGVYYLQLPASLGPVAEFADLIPTFINGASCTPDGTMCAPIGLVGQVDELEQDVENLEAAITILEGEMDTAQADILAIQGEVDALELNAVLKNPVAGIAYVGNQIIGPGSAGTVPWLSNSDNPIPFSAGDNNFDFTRVIVIDEFGNPVQAFTLNGNAEMRTRPSTRNRVGARNFESAEAVGYSTGQFVQWSSNPTNPALREPFLGGFGSAHATKPGWIEATRVINALLGLRVEGNYNALVDDLNFRGRTLVPGAPAAQTWLVGDTIIDSQGVVYICTVAGTPGTWVGVNAPSNFINLVPGVNITLAAKAGASRLERGGDATRLRGTLVASAPIAANAVLANIGTVAHRPLSAVNEQVRYSGGGARFQIALNGDISIGAALALNDQVWLDGITFDLSA